MRGDNMCVCKTRGIGVEGGWRLSLDAWQLSTIPN